MVITARLFDWANLNTSMCQKSVCIIISSISQPQFPRNLRNTNIPFKLSKRLGRSSDFMRIATGHLHKFHSRYNIQVEQRTKNSSLILAIAQKSQINSAPKPMQFKAHPASIHFVQNLMLPRSTYTEDLLPYYNEQTDILTAGLIMQYCPNVPWAVNTCVSQLVDMYFQACMQPM